jgi:CHASE1-domain containing sensor protein
MYEVWFWFPFIIWIISALYLVFASGRSYQYYLDKNDKITSHQLQSLIIKFILSLLIAPIAVVLIHSYTKEFYRRKKFLGYDPIDMFE